MLYVVIRGYICLENRLVNLAYDSFDDYMFSYKLVLY